MLSEVIFPKPAPLKTWRLQQITTTLSLLSVMARALREPWRFKRSRISFRDASVQINSPFWCFIKISELWILLTTSRHTTPRVTPQLLSATNQLSRQERNKKTEKQHWETAEQPLQSVFKPVKVQFLSQCPQQFFLPPRCIKFWEYSKRCKFPGTEIYGNCKYFTRTFGSNSRSAWNAPKILSVNWP